MRSSRLSRALALVAVAAFVFLLRPYCDVVNSAHAGTTNEPSHRGTDTQEHGQSAPADICPSLDHMPVVLPDAGSPLPVDLTPTLLPTDALSPVASATTDPQPVIPRATPPPGKRLPLYIRFAHLLI
jgi:hypothetical protein